MKKRLLWLDYVKGICMLAVILNHTNVPASLGSITYPYELVGFFFVSGYTFNRRDSFHSFLIAKVKSLIVPLLCFGLLNVTLSYVLKGGSLTQRIVGLACQIPGRWDDVWFFASLFSMEMVFYLISSLKSHWSQAIVCVVLFVLGILMANNIHCLIPWHLENTCLLIPFLFAGFCAHEVNERHVFCCGIKSHISILLALGITYLFFVFFFKNYPIDVHLLEYGNLPIFLLQAISGLSFIICISLLLERLSKPIRFLGFVGMNTLVFYGLQSKAIYVVSYTIDHFPNFADHGYIHTLVELFCVCALLSIFAVFVNKYMPWMLGRFDKGKSRTI